LQPLYCRIVRVVMHRILIVEDDSELLLLLEHVLLGADYRVDIARNVQGAMALLGKRHYDLVVSDGRLEDGTGMMIAERAEQNGIRALIITGYAFELPKEELGRYDFLLKPVRPDELLEAVERKLQTARS